MFRVIVACGTAARADASATVPVEERGGAPATIVGVRGLTHSEVLFEEHVVDEENAGQQCSLRVGLEVAKLQPVNIGVSRHLPSQIAQVLGGDLDDPPPTT